MPSLHMRCQIERKSTAWFAAVPHVGATVTAPSRDPVTHVTDPYMDMLGRNWSYIIRRFASDKARLDLLSKYLAQIHIWARFGQSAIMWG